MHLTVYPGTLRGSVPAPPSKSHAHRLLIAAALCQEGHETRILCPEDNEDISATVRCLEGLGARIRREGDTFLVRRDLPFGFTEGTEMDCGESGSTLRFLLPLCAALPRAADEKPDAPCRLTGHGRLPKRPNLPLLEVLRAHGAKIDGNDLPITTCGGLQAGDFSLPGHVSSQYFSGLLFALPLLESDSTLRFTSPLESEPYVHLTIQVLRQFGIRIDSMESGWRIPGKQTYFSPGSLTAEGDWSAAAFFIAANALGSSVKVEGLNAASCQGDKAIHALLKQIGGDMDVTQTPDLMPVLSVAAAASPGKTTRITGAARLRLKESNRLAAMAGVISCLGGQAQETPDGLIIHGTQLQGGVIDGQRDHRVVMSAAVAATVCTQPVTIRDAEAVNKSYPGFWRDFKELGGIVHA